MRFQTGDKVICIKPKSISGSEFDLDPNRVYTIKDPSHTAVTLQEIGLGYYIDRFQLAKETLFDNLYKRMTQ